MKTQLRNVIERWEELQTMRGGVHHTLVFEQSRKEFREAMDKLVIAYRKDN